MPSSPESYVQSQHERDADQETARRITAQSDEAEAYKHASHGCPNGWPDAPCEVCEASPDANVWYV